MPVQRTAYGITYYAYSLHDWRALRAPHDIPRAHWPILRRAGWPTSGANYEPANRVDRRVGAIPQLGGVDHIGAGFQDNNPADLGAERLTEYGLSPGNNRASWNGAVDSNTICLLAPPDTRPWQHGVSGSPYDLNSWGLGVEDGILSTNWDALPEPKRTAHLRMRAAWWALWMGYLRWPLKYTSTAAGVWDHIRRGESWGLTQHGIVDPANRTDAGLVYRGGRRVNTFPYDTLFKMIREEQAIRTSGGGTTPGLPADNLGFPVEDIKKRQAELNDLGYGPLDVDGRLGPLTQTAVRAYQADAGLTLDGLPGPTTTASLEDTMSKIDDVLREVTTVTLSAADYRDITGQEVDGPQTVTQDYVDRLTMRRVYNTLRHARAIDTTLAAQGKVLEQLATGQGIDPAAVRAAVDDAVRGSLDDLTADVRDALLTEGVADTVAARVVATIATRLNQES